MSSWHLQAWTNRNWIWLETCHPPRLPSEDTQSVSEKANVIERTVITSVVTRRWRKRLFVCIGPLAYQMGKRAWLSMACKKVFDCISGKKRKRTFSRCCCFDWKDILFTNLKIYTEVIALNHRLLWIYAHFAPILTPISLCLLFLKVSTSLVGHTRYFSSSITAWASDFFIFF